MKKLQLYLSEKIPPWTWFHCILISLSICHLQGLKLQIAFKSCLVRYASFPLYFLKGLCQVLYWRPERDTVMARQVSTQHPRGKLTRSQGIHHSFLSAPTAPGNTTLSTLRPCQPVWKLSVYVSVSSRLSRSQSTWGLRAHHVVGTQSTWAELNWITINNLHCKQYRQTHADIGTLYTPSWLPCYTENTTVHYKKHFTQVLRFK